MREQPMAPPDRLRFLEMRVAKAKISLAYALETAMASYPGMRNEISCSARATLAFRKFTRNSSIFRSSSRSHIRISVTT